MTLIEQVAAICRRLIPRGWGPVLALHGLRLDDRTLSNNGKLAAELERSLSTIDRSVKGFEDFSPDGHRAIQKGAPGRSLLYHAFASPLVQPFLARDMSEYDYPSLHELDAIENYIYSRARRSMRSLQADSARRNVTLAVAVFAYQYRIGARSANGKFADVAFSRTGVARVGTHRPTYDRSRRSFWPVVSDAMNEIAVMPSRYAAFLAEWRTPCPDDAISSEQPGDDDRSFLFPVHKLFEGTECLRGADIGLTFHELHRNEKLRRLHEKDVVALVDGFDISKFPFVRQTDVVRDLVRLKRVGGSVLLTPVEHRQLVRYARQRNRKTRRLEIARFVVPKEDDTIENRFASSFQYLDPVHAERRPAPEYLNIRHRVNDPMDVSRIEDLNRLPVAQFRRLMKSGGYEAAHFIDDTCEGCIVVDVEGVDLDQPDVTNFSAYSIVAPPDFFPLVDQADVMDWIDRVLQGSGEREHFAQGGPRPLSQRRNCINVYLLRPNSQAPASSVRYPADASRTETLTALVGGSRSRTAAKAPLDGSRYLDPSTTFLADAASGIFDPGWDISFSGNDEADFIAASGLGNPFPEDAKLCAALNSYWPSVAPDATRTFGLYPPDWSATTSIPLMDGELGFHPRHPLVLAGLVESAPGWDGEYGPFFDQGGRYVNHADLDRTDYVSRALRRELSLTRLSVITPGEFFRRMNALRACIGVLPESPRRVSGTKLFLVSALKVADWTKESDRGDPRLLGEGYRFEFAILDGKARTVPREDHRVRRKVAKGYTCQIAAQGVCWRHEAPDQGDFVFYPTALLV